LLVDTYDVATAVELAVAVAGPELGAVRLDSGDLTALAHDVRRQLDRLGATDTRIVVTSDLDEHAIAALAVAPVDGYGVGTSLVTGSGHPTCGFVYKLVARSGSGDAADTVVPVAKKSNDKLSIGGRKWAVRQRDRGGVARVEVIGIGSRPAVGPHDRELMVPLVRSGEVVGREPLDAARERHLRVREELPGPACQLSRGEPAVLTDYLGDGRPGSTTPFVPDRASEEASR
jgi:nicotinate phosphoribosyltransferase